MKLSLPVFLFFLFCAVDSIQARTLWENGTDSGDTFALNSAFKGAALQTNGPLMPADSEAISLFFGRIRIEPLVHIGSLVLDAAYDNQLIEESQPVSSFAVLPNTLPAPYRIKQIGGTVFQSGTGKDYQELDRLFAAYREESFQVTLGRQAIGWGRATTFSAVDIFSPFTPFEFDREWKRGADALRIEEKLSAETSGEIILAAGPDWDDSELGGRFRGETGRFDFEALAAKRARDSMWAGTTSAFLAGAEVHLEFALFHTPDDFPSEGFFGNRAWIPKGVAGISNNFQIGNGVASSFEYHYSGFGASSAAEFNQWVQIPSYQNRISRGDTQIEGNQASVLTFDYTVNESWEVALEALQSLIDRSGAFIPNVTWTLSDRTSVLATALIAYGAGPTGTRINSQFGSAAQLFIAQWRFYD